MPNKTPFMIFTLLVALAAGGYVLLRQPQSKPGTPSTATSADGVDALARQKAKAVLDERKKTDETVWAKEVKAQDYEEVFINLWNDLLKSPNQLEKLSQFQFGKLLAGQPATPVPHPYGITVSPLTQNPVEMDGAQLKALAAQIQSQGIRLNMTEWHHKKFDTFEDGTAASTLSMTLYFEHAGEKKRWVVNGDLKVKWPVREPGKPFSPALLDTTQLTLAFRQGPLAYTEIPAADLGQKTEIPAGGHLLVYDLNRDGLDDIILPGRNIVYWNKGGFKFEPKQLLDKPGFPAVKPEQIMGTAVIADFTGDGHPDLLLSGRSLGIMLYAGDSTGHFPEAGRLLFQFADPKSSSPSAVTAGDINGDGKLDFWLTQYRQPYERGQMPSPYFDANDGYPSYLFLNQGNGKFLDATAGSGLEAKRYRRTYSTSFVDLDDDQDLDLVVVSDFSGVDVYRNNGKGIFEDITSTAIDERANFGMSHAFADFNHDGKLDFLVTGMSSTTARRLEHMQLGREDFPEHQKMRMPMGYGNRLYLRQSDGSFRQPAWRDMVARSGWSWGCSAFDLGNDGLIDIFIANGHISGPTTKDYCTRFWTQDIYTGSPKVDPGFALVMQEESKNTKGWSWNGYEKKALFLAEANDRYMNSSFLLGTAFEYDARHVVMADLDNDGRRDLLIVEQQNSAQPNEQRVLHILRNTFETKNNWVGFRFTEAPGFSPVGTRIILKTAAGLNASCLANGDSFDSQHPLVVHYGLGTNTKIEEAQIYWPNGKKTIIPNPTANQYHNIPAPQ
jgi:hypothetical protein